MPKKSINVQGPHKQSDEAYHDGYITYSLATPRINSCDPI